MTEKHNITFTFIHLQQHRYLLSWKHVLFNRTWMEAQRYCRENYTDLVSVRNQTENDLIHNMTRNGTWVWIGLYRDYWQWSDQRNSSFRKPDSYDGNEKCTVASITPTHSGTWDDRQCGENHPFLCYDDGELSLICRTISETIICS
uniref:C-type lectin domain-containing protein n=1 Tax=Scleropages formosus TaxID=113540 RepID=A0A8C9WJS2_SCLFO